MTKPSGALEVFESEILAKLDNARTYSGKYGPEVAVLLLNRILVDFRKNASDVMERLVAEHRNELREKLSVVLVKSSLTMPIEKDLEDVKEFFSTSYGRLNSKQKMAWKRLPELEAMIQKETENMLRLAGVDSISKISIAKIKAMKLPVSIEGELGLLGKFPVSLGSSKTWPDDRGRWLMEQLKKVIRADDEQTHF